MHGIGKEHAAHAHGHGSNCGHLAVTHEGHTDYIHDGHLHHVHNGQVEEHSVSVDKVNPDACTPDHKCTGHDSGHKHTQGCGHEPVPHGNHIDYLVNGHLHHSHGSHCDNHGSLQAA